MDTMTARINGPLPSVMKAWQYTNARGCLEMNLHLNNAATLPRPPAPGSGGVLIEVISMAPPIRSTTSLPSSPLSTDSSLSKPASPGLDFCGRVVSCADGKTGSSRSQPLRPGELVFDRLQWAVPHGTLGQFIRAPSIWCRISTCGCRCRPSGPALACPH
jgi:hypothetical protein